MAMSYEDSKSRDEIVETSEKLIFDITQKSHNDGLVRVSSLTSETIKANCRKIWYGWRDYRSYNRT